MGNGVDHPDYYAGDIECIDAMKQSQGRPATVDFCVCNAFKYLWRWRHKDGARDLEKARWYLDYAILLMSLTPEHDAAMRGKTLDEVLAELD